MAEQGKVRAAFYALARSYVGTVGERGGPPSAPGQASDAAGQDTRDDHASGRDSYLRRYDLQVRAAGKSTRTP